MRGLASFLIVLLGGGLSFSEEAPAVANPPVLVELESTQGVIFPAGAGEQFWHLHGRNRPPSAFWTAAEDDVRALEKRLPQFLEHAEVGLSRPLTNYRRQYLGIVVAGRRLLHANFVCEEVLQEEVGREWMRQPVQVDDGGDCFFGVDFEADSGAFSELSVNGEA